MLSVNYCGADTAERPPDSLVLDASLKGESAAHSLVSKYLLFVACLFCLRVELLKLKYFTCFVKLVFFSIVHLQHLEGLLHIFG